METNKAQHTRDGKELLHIYTYGLDAVEEQGGEGWGPEHQDARDRIVSCVNACRGIEDPAAAIPAMVEALEGVVAWADRNELSRSGHPLSGWNEIFRARAAIALAGKEGR